MRHTIAVIETFPWTLLTPLANNEGVFANGSKPAATELLPSRCWGDVGFGYLTEEA